MIKPEQILDETDMKVTLIDHMGSDLSVVNAARVSFDKESEWQRKTIECPEGKDGCLVRHFKNILSDKDAKLISYLAKHKHWTPFAHTALSFRIKAPIFVARQLGKHQVGLVWNEVSRRYIDSEPEFYMPDMWRKRAENVKQGSSDEAVWYSSSLNESVELWHSEALDCYNRMILNGVCPEQARMVLPQSMMTEWIWTGSVAAFARVCKLRLDGHTQAETRVVAWELFKHCETLFPVSWKALMNDD